MFASDAKLLRSFWGGALDTIAHVINLNPIIALEADVLDWVWYEDQTIEYFDKAKKSKSKTDGLIDLDPTPTVNMPNAVEVDVQNDT
ncbi:hypothetical protein GH714_012118 [Hevea brasiliensis]|uniref:Uncharacterized protein n=1 Tax=Hevea brasiliensis TaxID=3981 RepID=A0A6A6NCS1_HEVBR|nr:hypothetical protein GH714_012118 [Hevea brasiliensis]